MLRARTVRIVCVRHRSGLGIWWRRGSGGVARFSLDYGLPLSSLMRLDREQQVEAIVQTLAEALRAEGRNQGRAEGERLLTQRLLERKFPRVAEQVATRLETLDESSLLAFGEALLFFETEADCLGWFEGE